MLGLLIMAEWVGGSELALEGACRGPRCRRCCRCCRGCTAGLHAVLLHTQLPALQTTYLPQIEVDTNNEQVVLGAGVRFRELIEAVSAEGYAALTGDCPTVGEWQEVRLLPLRCPASLESLRSLRCLQ